MKHMLGSMALQKPDRFFSTFGPAGDRAYLADLWNGMGMELPENERVSSDGISSELFGFNGYEMLLVTMPAATEPNEAYFVVVVRKGEECRVFFLERSGGWGKLALGTMVAELSAGGRRNRGTGPEPLAGNFVEFVRQLLCDPADTANG
ncbi:MAG TPA: hypothetical protein VHM90_11535 [Phycisphaerae bacterium]|nr:hypothetical protein [Phycisphaerae bacterium]